MRSFCTRSRAEHCTDDGRSLLPLLTRAALVSMMDDCSPVSLASSSRRAGASRGGIPFVALDADTHPAALLHGRMALLGGPETGAGMESSDAWVGHNTASSLTLLPVLRLLAPALMTTPPQGPPIWGRRAVRAPRYRGE